MNAPETPPAHPVASQARWRARTYKGLGQGLLSATAGAIAWGIALNLHAREGFWAAITAVAVTQSDFMGTRNTARDQCIGAAIGSVFGGAFALVLGQHTGAFFLAVVLSVLCCSLLGAPSATRLAAITATVILLIPRSGSVAAMVAARVGEVALGSLVAFTTSLAWRYVSTAKLSGAAGRASEGRSGPRAR